MHCHMLAALSFPVLMSYALPTSHSYFTLWSVHDRGCPMHYLLRILTSLCDLCMIGDVLCITYFTFLLHSVICAWLGMSLKCCLSFELQNYSLDYWRPGFWVNFLVLWHRSSCSLFYYQWPHHHHHTCVDFLNQSFIYSPTDEPVSCLKNNIKIYIKTAPDMFRCYSYTIIRKHINLCLLKLQLLK